LVLYLYPASKIGVLFSNFFGIGEIFFEIKEIYSFVVVGTLGWRCFGQSALKILIKALKKVGFKIKR
jgi:hypothetical protein